MSRIAICCGSTSRLFLDCVERILTEGGHETRRFTTPDEIPAALAWADGFFAEWLDSSAVKLSRSGALAGRPFVVRAHRYEAWTEHPAALNWDYPNLRVVFTCPENRDSAVKRLPPAAAAVARWRMIPELVDLDRFPLRADKAPAGEIGWASYLNARKDPILALMILCAVKDADPTTTWRLHFAGTWQDEDLRESFAHATRRMGLADSVVMHGWVEDMAAWWRDKDACLVTSWSETGPVNAIEAMATGVQPIVRDHPGAAGRFGGDCVWSTIEGAVEMLTLPPLDGAAYRERAAEFGLDANRGKILGLFS